MSLYQQTSRSYWLVSAGVQVGIAFKENLYNSALLKLDQMLDLSKINIIVQKIERGI
jgi:hypothetical protein